MCAVVAEEMEAACCATAEAQFRWGKYVGDGVWPGGTGDVLHKWMWEEDPAFEKFIALGPGARGALFDAVTLLGPAVERDSGADVEVVQVRCTLC